MDYCTLWFEGWWSHCCQAHDAAYDTQIAKDIADQALLACVSSSLPELAVQHPVITGVFAVGSTVIGGAMYLAVRIFGAPFYKRAGQSTSSKDARNG